jgi:hypothetical protein
MPGSALPDWKYDWSKRLLLRWQRRERICWISGRACPQCREVMPILTEYAFTIYTLQQLHRCDFRQEHPSTKTSVYSAMAVTGGIHALYLNLCLRVVHSRVCHILLALIYIKHVSNFHVSVALKVSRTITIVYRGASPFVHWCIFVSPCLVSRSSGSGVIKELRLNVAICFEWNTRYNRSNLSLQ